MLAKHKATLKNFALKIFEKASFAKDNNLIDIDREIKALNACRGIRQIIQMYEVFETKETVVLVTNYLEGNDIVHFAQHLQIEKFS